MVNQKKVHKTAILILTLTAITGRADNVQEAPPLDPSLYSGINYALYPGNGLAQSTAGGIMSQEGTAPEVRGDTQVIDRQINADQSASQSGAGSGAAAAAGAAMISTGVPMTLSIIPSVVAAGWTLIGMGITELAQSSASGAAQDGNKNTGNILGNQMGMLGNQVTPQQAAENTKLPPELENMLSNMGLNPQDIVKQAANGGLTNPEDILKAFGKPVSADDLALAKNLVGDELNKVGLGEILKVDDANQQLALTTFGPKASGDVPAAAASISAHSEVPRVGAAVAGVASTAGAVRTGKETVPGVADDFTADILAKWGLGGATLAPEQKKAIVDMVLAQNGIGRTSPGDNIFQQAGRKFKSYDKWRVKARVARL